jgi:CBS domain containing-hemolysin-like protein
MSGDGFAVEIALIAALILLNGFFAGAEIAVISARGGRIQPRAQFLATVQIGSRWSARWHQPAAA